MAISIVRSLYRVSLQQTIKRRKFFVVLTQYTSIMQIFLIVAFVFGGRLDIDTNYKTVLCIWLLNTTIVNNIHTALNIIVIVLLH